MCPIYELSCANCPKVIEVLTSYEEYTTTSYKCTMCGLELDKQLSKTTFRLYGEGVYSPSKSKID